MPLRLFVLILSMVLFTTSVRAEDEPINLEIIEAELEAPQKRERQWRLLLSVGHFGEHKKSVDGETWDNNSQPTFIYGLEFGQYHYTLSHYTTANVSGTGNFQVFSRRRSWILGAQYTAKDYGFWSPVVGVDAGLYSESVKTRFGGVERNSEGQTLLLAAMSAGIQFRFLEVMYSDLLFKAVKRESNPEMEFASQATLGLRL